MIRSFEKPTRGQRVRRGAALGVGSMLLIAGCGGGSEGSSAESQKPTKPVATATTSRGAERSDDPTATASATPTEGYSCGEKRDGKTQTKAKAGEVAIKFCDGGEKPTIVQTYAGPTKDEADKRMVGTYFGEAGHESTSAVDCQVFDGRPIEMPGTGESTTIWYGIAPDSRVPSASAEFVTDAFVKIDLEKAAALPVCDLSK